MVVAIIMICLFVIVARISLKSSNDDNFLNHTNRLRSNPIFRKRRK